MKIPRKKELLELQKKYRTDKKIGEVYGVPSRLVAYWRSKKKIGQHNFPKHSREKIIDLWERFGDDRKAGAELGISGPGFRQWRIKYGIKNRPAQLKMEQLELDLRDTYKKTKSLRKETFIRKILAKKAGLKRVEEGQIVNIQPDLAISSDDTDEVINEFKKTGITRVRDHSRIAIILDHGAQNESAHMTKVHRCIREFVKKQGIERFYDVGWGVAHQVMLEEGLVLPGRFVVGTDNQAISYGGIGSFSINISPLEMAVVWATGRIWLKVPQTIKVMITGSLARGVYIKDAIMKLSRILDFEDVNYKAIEFGGDTVSSATISQRIALTGFTAEIGAKSAMVPFDEITQRYLKKITKEKFSPLAADPNAQYENEIELDVSYLTPQVASGSDFADVRPVEEMVGKRIDQVLLCGCSSGRLDDFEVAARILRGRRIHRDTRIIVVPGSRRTYLDAIDKGFIRTLVESGCMIFNPGCGPCLASHEEMCSGDEIILTTSHRIFKRHKASTKSQVFLASSATAAATALEGSIADPRKYLFR